MRDADLWHQVHAQREDGLPARFLIREVDPRADQPQILMIQVPYPTIDASKLPDAESMRQLDTFQEQWVEPACEALGWTLVACKSEDGAFLLYLYGDGDPNAVLEKLARYEGDLGFFHERDADWSEYAALRELVDQAQAAPGEAGEDGHVHTAACDHDHGNDYGNGHGNDHVHGHGNDHDVTSHGITVIDLTGDPPAGQTEPARPRATRPGATRAKAKAPAARARTGTSTKPAPTTRATAKARATKTTRTRPATPKPRTADAKRSARKSTKPAAKKPAPNKTPARRPTASKRQAPRTPRR